MREDVNVGAIAYGVDETVLIRQSIWECPIMI
jgi:hypothetical protein